VTGDVSREDRSTASTRTPTRPFQTTLNSWTTSTRRRRRPLSDSSTTTTISRTTSERRRDVSTHAPRRDRATPPPPPGATTCCLRRLRDHLAVCCRRRRGVNSWRRLSRTRSAQRGTSSPRGLVYMDPVDMFTLICSTRDVITAWTGVHGPSGHVHPDLLNEGRRHRVDWCTWTQWTRPPRSTQRGTSSPRGLVYMDPVDTSTLICSTRDVITAWTGVRGPSGHVHPDLLNEGRHHRVDWCTWTQWTRPP